MRVNLNPLSGGIREVRVVSKFLWFPLVLNEELRWLEKVNILQEIKEVDVGGSMEYGKFKSEWVSTAFAD
ncbi:hypothetical protein BSK59_16165 [Paenibacillus odorifer]|uniref:hypothetical protein n=1 Tax=Paenibacillus odorifer TaxID=189426 RepID=UPI00096FFAA8|nr:hypothetical protein [Paenibacillus odorifer]OME54114.1 hypothetical protein BSK59_16165 [Paenibacillus odorifer]